LPGGIGGIYDPKLKISIRIVHAALIFPTNQLFFSGCGVVVCYVIVEAIAEVIGASFTCERQLSQAKRE